MFWTQPLTKYETMKLILCKECEDVIKLQYEMRFCKCKKSYGKYVKDAYAEYAGPCVPLGLQNLSLATAIRNQPLFSPGRKFEAFVIPTISKTCKRMENDQHNSKEP